MDSRNKTEVHSWTPRKKCRSEMRTPLLVSYPLGNTIQLKKPVTPNTVNKRKDTTLTCQIFDDFLFVIFYAPDSERLKNEQNAHGFMVDVINAGD